MTDPGYIASIVLATSCELALASEKLANSGLLLPRSSLLPSGSSSTSIAARISSTTRICTGGAVTSSVPVRVSGMTESSDSSSSRPRPRRSSRSLPAAAETFWASGERPSCSRTVWAAS